MALPTLPDGSMVGRYRVSKKLGEGGFGAVYKVQDDAGQLYAMKVEGANEQIQVLKLEVYVLDDLARRGGRHFCRIEDKGRNASFNYVIMTLVGQSLQDLRKACPGQKFSLQSAICAGIQTLEALEDLHGVGYLHRDVKPGNYAVGREELGELRKVYVLDFGMCRSFLNKQGQVRTPRAAAGFRGTVRYAPISCHVSRELCRKDDLETWFYMLVELSKGAVPWSKVEAPEQVHKAKMHAREGLGLKEMLGGLPREFATVLTYVDGLRYYDKPEYERVYGLLRQALRGNGGNENAPYDWEKGGAHRGQTQMLPAPGFNPHAGVNVIQW